MKKKLLSLLLALFVLAALLTACGGASKEYAAMDQAAPEAMEEAPMEMNGSLTASGSGGSTALPENRKWVVTVHMQAETDDLETMTAALDEKIKELGGYVEDQSIYNGSTYSSRRYRYANLTVRIPAEDVGKFTEDVAGIANVVSQETTREDITLTYVSTESRLTALQVEEARLLELLEKAETMADLLEIESRLTDVRYELENYASRLRVYDNQVDYATIHLNIEEVQEYTPVAEPTLWERITGSFSDSIDGLIESLQDLLVFIVTVSPFLVVYGGVALVVLLLIKRIRKSSPSAKRAPVFHKPQKKNNEEKK